MSKLVPIHSTECGVGRLRAFAIEWSFGLSLRSRLGVATANGLPRSWGRWTQTASESSEGPGRFLGVSLELLPSNAG